MIFSLNIFWQYTRCLSRLFSFKNETKPFPKTYPPSYLPQLIHRSKRSIFTISRYCEFERRRVYFFLFFFFFLTSTYTYIFRVTCTIIWERREKAGNSEQRSNDTIVVSRCWNHDAGDRGEVLQGWRPI